MASKARMIIERAVPELEDLEKKGLFQHKEVTMIMRRRTDFEQRILGRGASPLDFIKYTDFEINLEKLRRKRFDRLRQADLVDLKPSISDWAGFRRIVFTFDRAVRKYPGDLDLWARYLRFVKEKDAVKVVYRVYAKLLLLQPRNTDAWLLAAKYEFESNANAIGARDLYQRALQLNPDDTRLWELYAEFELAYVAKLLARRKVLGLLTESQQKADLQKAHAEYQRRLASGPDAVEGSDRIVLDAEEELKTLPEADMSVLGDPALNPVLRGDIALVVYDLCLPAVLKHVPAADKEARFVAVLWRFLAIFDEFPTLNRDHLYLHVVHNMQKHYPQNTQTVLADVTLPLRAMKVSDAGFAESLQLAVNKYLAYQKQNKSLDLTAAFVLYLDKFVDGASATAEKLLRAIIAKVKA